MNTLILKRDINKLELISSQYDHYQETDPRYED